MIDYGDAMQIRIGVLSQEQFQQEGQQFWYLANVNSKLFNRIWGFSVGNYLLVNFTHAGSDIRQCLRQINSTSVLSALRR